MRNANTIKAENTMMICFFSKLPIIGGTPNVIFVFVSVLYLYLLDKNKKIKNLNHKEVLVFNYDVFHSSSQKWQK